MATAMRRQRLEYKTRPGKAFKIFPDPVLRVSKDFEADLDAVEHKSKQRTAFSALKTVQQRIAYDTTCTHFLKIFL